MYEPTAWRIHQTLDFSRCSSSAHASALGVCPSLAARRARTYARASSSDESLSLIERAQGFRWEADAPSCTHTPCTTTLHSYLSPLSPYTPLSHHPTAASAPSSSGAHPVQAVGATVPPSAHTG